MADRIKLGKQYQDNSDLVIPLWRTYPDGRKERITSFASQEELLKAMDAVDPNSGESLYAKSELFRASVEEIINNTPAEVIGVQLEQRSPIPTDEEMLQGLREDALRQQYQRMVDAGGGNDAIAKYNLALMLTNPTEEQYANYQDMQQLTQPEGNRPYENYLKERKAAGLGPQQDNVPMESEEERAAKEVAHNEEVLTWLASQDIGDSITIGDEGVEV
ncbi:MAG: hypothetical protein KF693_05170 [Nitrospira sp.]|nr:hypothetical protein [Nitrospira sp.]